MKKNAAGLVWLASYPKSGNTWTRNFLHNLLNVMSGEDDVPQDINAMNAFSTWDVNAKLFEKFLGKAISESCPEEIAATRPAVQEYIAHQANGLAFVKTHHALVKDRGHPVINFDVTSGAVYIVRNPLDVAASFANHLDTNIDNAIEQMGIENAETPVTDEAVYEVYGSWSQHVDSWTRKPHRAIYVMRYEDMLSRPHKIFGDLSNHLLLKPDKYQLDRAIKSSSFEVMRKQEQEAVGGFKEKPKASKQFFRSGKAGGWQHELTEEQIHRIINRHRNQMIRFGYVPDGF